jgi:hypothetical protein
MLWHGFRTSDNLLTLVFCECSLDPADADAHCGLALLAR